MRACRFICITSRRCRRCRSASTLIERLLKAYPANIAGVKDSSGDWNNTKAMLDRFAADGFDVFAGSESFLLANMRNGGKGCISATANVNPAAIHHLYANWKSADADQLQAKLDAIRGVVPEISDDPGAEAGRRALERRPGWARVRPPLVELNAAQSAALIADLEQRGFSMPGLQADREAIA